MHADCTLGQASSAAFALAVAASAPLGDDEGDSVVQAEALTDHNRPGEPALLT
jgi:hypothetical protein